MITCSVRRLIAVIFLSYTAVNLLFAAVYYSMGPENFGGIRTDSETDKFLSLFFFSAQTLTTVGYGHVYPLSHWGSMVASVESLLGLMGFALATGLLYGRFSRPRADILYSKNCIISPYLGMKGLMFRIANKKHYELIESEISVTLAFTDEKTGKRQFKQLKLEISRINYLALSWTVVHPIDAESPVKGWSLDDFKVKKAEVLILMKAINDTFSQQVYSRHSYTAAEMVDSAKFIPLEQSMGSDGRVRVNISEIDRIESV
jgi:inward rectifier potassium channel